jgi:hypothetical protein
MRLPPPARREIEQRGTHGLARQAGLHQRVM